MTLSETVGPDRERLLSVPDYNKLRPKLLSDVPWDRMTNKMEEQCVVDPYAYVFTAATARIKIYLEPSSHPLPTPLIQTTMYSPMRRTRLVALLMAWAWGIISASSGLNALIKSNNQEGQLRRLLPPNSTLDIDIDDVFHTGVVVTVVSLVVAILCTIYVLLLLASFSKGNTRISRTSDSTLPFQWMTLGFCAVWLFATQIPFTVFFANNSAKIHASIGSLVLPEDTIKRFEGLLGVSSTYRHIDYLRLVAIFPWFTILFTTIAAIVCFLASRRRGRGDHTPNSTSTHRKSEEPDVV
ncbi:hypothetical protein AAF712_003701 [Marasmius tenuissimus]|uniref:Uncharacterized protein n=1 Tax=Marasmius tenuissimus TaxID=585030 RepID=A0ABR3A5R9_9AGAR